MSSCGVGPTTFLLVEDEENDVLLMEEQFRRSPRPINFQHVPDGVEAMRYLKGEMEFEDRRKYPLPNVILLDLKMPRFSGFDFLEWLHRDSPGHLRLIPVVVMSSSNEPGDIQRAYALGANTYMLKPVQWTDFRERIHALGIYWTAHAETPHLTPAEPRIVNPANNKTTRNAMRPAS